MRYPLNLEPAEEGGFVVTLPDIPEVITQGDDKKSALAMALDGLITALEFYFDDRRQVPKPSRIKSGGDFVELPPSVAAKVLLHNEMVVQQARP